MREGAIGGTAARATDGVIKEVIVESDAVRTFCFQEPHSPWPGQYMMVWVRGVDEIPMSFSGPDRMTVHAVGEATRALFDLQAGDALGLRGPLGNGFSLVGEKILLVGGGVGVAPLAFLGDEARKAGMEVTSLIGFRTASDVVLKSRLEGLGELILTTDDGSAGVKGFVSAGLAKVDLEEVDQIYLCGPELMMWDVINRCRSRADRIQACINRYFKCAVGVCGSCCLDPEGIRVCAEGPVITAERLLEGEFGRYRRGPSGSIGSCQG
ncbi:MAG: dihydroorotate dehydrogenase electron transfer subunit [Methanosarcinales archaeon]|nr:dihydroorotate dehydrogenase electron transfer subunit [Methanosarcinales archaeon]